MKPFRFTLEAVRTLRKRQEQEAMEAYAAAVATRQKALEGLREAERECEAAWAMSRERKAGGAPAAHLSQVEDYCRLAEEFKKCCAEMVVEAQRKTDLALEKLLAARQAREAVDKFRQRQRDRYKRELAREEQKVLDEIGQQRAPVALGRAESRGGAR